MKNWKWQSAGVVAILIAQALLLHYEGRLWICACGYVQVWHGLVASSGNSQHLFDWYSFTHVLHGMLWYLLLWIIDRKKRLSFGTKLLIATGLEAGWEVLENSAWVIDRYRATTISLDYYGDTVINSLSDVVCMIIGFYIASRVRWYWSVVIFVVIEVMLAMAIRDNLTTNIIMLIHPVEAIKHWQAKGQNF